MRHIKAALKNIFMTREQKILSLLAQFKELGIDKQIDYDKFYLVFSYYPFTAIEGSICH